MALARIGVGISVLALLTACATSETDFPRDEGELGGALEAEISRSRGSEVQGCHFFVDSNYGGNTLWMARGTTIGNLKDRGMNDKISSVYFRGGATARMWIHRNHEGTDWSLSSDVSTFHTSAWGNLGDNASSIDCY